MNRREAAATLQEIRGLMARAGEYRHLSGWAAILNGLLVFAGCAVSKWVAHVSFYPSNQPVRLLKVWGAVAAAGFVLDILFTVALARRRGEPAWSPGARQFVAGLLPGLYAGAILTVYLVHQQAYDALPGIWMVCYGTALMGASLFTQWAVRYFGLGFLLFGGVALMFLRDYAMWSMGLGFGATHLLFGAYVLWRYRGEGEAPHGEGDEAVSGPDAPEEDEGAPFRTEAGFGWEAGPQPTFGYGDEKEFEN